MPSSMKNQLFVILSIFLIFAVTGSFAFSLTEQRGYAEIDKTEAACYFLQTDNGIDCIVAGMSILQRNKLPCVFAYTVTHSFPALNFAKVLSSLINNDNTLIYKNNILLKLLI